MIIYSKFWRAMPSFLTSRNYLSMFAGSLFANALLIIVFIGKSSC
jgi:hypothetical protein